MNKNKQLAINMAAQIIALGTNFLVSFFLTPYIINNIGSEAYGFVGLANNFISYIIIITTALNSMASRFITINIHQEKYEETNRYFTSVIFANIIISIPVTIIGTLLIINLSSIVNVPENILEDVTILWALLLANFILDLIGNVFKVATFAKNRLELASLRNIESNVIKVSILVVLFYFLKPSVWYLGLSTLICGIYVIITNIYYTKRLLPNIKIKKKYIDLLKIKELVFSGIWNSLTNISSTLSTGLDLLITNLFVGATAMGVVSLAKTLPTYVLSIFSMLSSVFAPQLTISYAKNDYKEMKNQLIASIKILGMLACIPMVFLYIYGKEFYNLWVPTQDGELLQRLSILACIEFPFVLPLESLWNVFMVTNKVKQSSLFMFANALVSVTCVFILLQFANSDIQRMYIVVGVSAIISVIRGLTFLPIYGARCLRLKWYTFFPIIIRNVFSIIVISLVAILVKRIIVINSWITLIVTMIVISCISLILNGFILLSGNERIIIKTKIKNIVRKNK